jgi:hypothetical protein
MEENKKALSFFERHTFDIVQEMVNETSRKLGKSWKLDYSRVRSDSKQEFSIVSVYEGDRKLFRSLIGDNVAEACMYVVAFLNGINTALDLYKSH